MGVSVTRSPQHTLLQLLLVSSCVVAVLLPSDSVSLL
jgi:hypothetical protein